jgi:hypothetical protein
MWRQSISAGVVFSINIIAATVDGFPATDVTSESVMSSAVVCNVLDEPP